MSRERLPIEALYKAALQIPPPARSAFILEACGDDASLRAELEARLEQTAEALGIHPTGAEPPAEWGGLRLISEIGAGGFGHVYRAHDPTLARDVALKIVSLPTNADAATVLREGQMLARVRHRNVVTVHSAQRVADQVGVTMELVEGQNLDGLIRQHGPMGAEEAAVIGLSICQALAAVHGAGLVHRDVKAANVMRERGGRIVLMDFGLGLDVAAASMEDTVSGTPPYMAPELFDGYPATPASDLYSLGVLLFFLVTREYPVPGATVTGILEAHARRERRYLADVRPDLSAAFVKVVEQALARNPSERFPTAGAMMRALSEATPEASRAMPWVVRSGGAALSVWALGAITSVFFNVTLRRTGFSDDSILSWFTFGGRSLVAPAITAGLTLAVVAALRTIWRVLRRGVRPLTQSIESFAADVASAVGMGDATGRAQWLLAVQGVGLGLFVWEFQDIFRVVFDFPDFIEPASIAVFSRQSDRPLQYRQVMAVVLTLTVLAWRLLFRRPSARGLDASTKAGAIALSITMLIVLVLPYRLMFHSDRPVIEHAGLSCYDLGRRGDDVLVYCPAWDPPRIRRRLRREVTDTGLQEPMFTVPAASR